MPEAEVDGFAPPWWHGAESWHGQDDPQALQQLDLASERNGLLAPYVVHGALVARGLYLLADWMARDALQVGEGRKPEWAARILREAARDLDAWRALWAVQLLGGTVGEAAALAKVMEKVRTEGVEPSTLPV